MNPMSLPSHESIFAYLSSSSGDGMQHNNFLHLLLAVLRSEDEFLDALSIGELAWHLNDEQRRWLLKLAEAANRVDDAAIAAGITPEQYEQQSTPRFGRTNPEQMNMPLWTFMVQRGWHAYQARRQFSTDLDPLAGPGWCFDRFGQSLTRLPDGRLLYIAGEHEDFDDSDFYIYNDVITIERDLRITIYGYPEQVFPPTDFHTATLVGENEVYIIGNVGHQKVQQPGVTPVYRLNTTTMAIDQIPTTGSNPGWISRHKATYHAERHAICIRGGEVFTGLGWRTIIRSFWLDLERMDWTIRKE